MKNLAKIIFVFCLSLVLSNINAQTVQTFSYTGSVQAWSVPPCVTQITITVAGAQGGQGAGNEDFFNEWTDQGGLGGSASGTLNVSPGQNLFIYVGGYGIDGTNADPPSYGTGGWNGGGAGYDFNSGFYGPTQRRCEPLRCRDRSTHHRKSASRAYPGQ